MDSRRQGPLYSTRADDPEAMPALDRFVLDLAERVDLLQDADAAGDLAGLIGGADRLAAEAREVGHQTLATVATRVADVARRGKAEDAHGALVELTDIVLRVRRGHRGAL